MSEHLDQDDVVTDQDLMDAGEQLFTAEEERDAELRLDAEQEERDAIAAQQDQDAEGNTEECVPEMIDGTLNGCGACEQCAAAVQDDADEDVEWEAYA